MAIYSHLGGTSDFPNVQTVDAYKFDNDLDYSRYDYSQMDICVCRVPWDTGEVHVGTRAIEGIGNVVDFESKEARDAWFNTIPENQCFRWSTKYKELHKDLTLDVPLPFDVAATYNYVYVRYHLFANDSSKLEYETDDGLREWFYFIREVDFIAPNTTRLTLFDDAWQTFIYDFNVSSMVLERGHAPLFKTKASAYLANPLDNCTDLLTDDVNFGENLDRVAHTDVVSFNSSEVWAVIVSSGAWGTWGTMHQTSGWKTPANTWWQQDGAPSYYAFALEPDDLVNFMSAVDSEYPQFKQTVQGIFFIDKRLVSSYRDHEMFGITVHWINADPGYLDLTVLDKAQFGYADDYADLAKLYTFPYSALEITDEKGDYELVKIEETTGHLSLYTMVSLIFPYINISALIAGIGNGQSGLLTIRNTRERDFSYGGRWYAHVRSWDVPVFNVIQSNETFYGFDTYWDRVQMGNDAATAKSNADASADAAYSNAVDSANVTHTNAYNTADAQKANADNSADAQKANADNSADTVTENAALQTSANTAINTRSNTAASNDVTQTNAVNRIVSDFENNYTTENANASAEATTQTATLSAASSMATSAISAVTAGAAAGPAGSVVGALGGLVSGAINGATTMATGVVAANLTTTQAANAVNLNREKRINTNDLSVTRTRIQVQANNDNTDTTNDVITASSANSASTIKENATRTQEMVKGNASTTQSTAKTNADNSQNLVIGGGGFTGTAVRTHDTALANNQRTRDNATERIRNLERQADLGAPQVFGDVANAETATTRPMALFANVVTQSKSAIAAAGDEFLRYGYRYDHQWRFDGNWNIGKHYTYWKVRDLWTAGLNIPDAYADRIRFFLLGGVTIWRKPEDIGNVTIYDNWPEE